MAEIIKMPKLSDTMEEGVVATWHKQVGDTVEDGELLAEIETDKATMEYESFQSGVLLHQGVKEGETAAVDSVLAIVGEKGESFDDLLAGGAAAPAPVEAVQDEAAASVAAVAAPAVSVDTSNIAAKVIKMPKLSDTMTEGTVASWSKQIGDQVDSGELLAEIETDKATMEFESFEEGVLLYQGVAEGESAAVDSILAIVGEKGADYQALIDSFGQGEAAAEPSSTPVEVAAPVEKAVEPAAMPSSNANGRLKISPLAMRLAKEKNIDVTLVQGTGDGGRIIKRDILSFTPSASVAAPASYSSPAVEGGFEDKAVSQMRKVIAKRLGESKFSAPHFYLTIDLDMDNAIASRKAINEIPDTKVSFNDMVIKAASAALMKHPAVNSAWLEDKIRTFNYVNMGVAVAVDEGLVVPVVQNTHSKGLVQINHEVKDFASRARSKKIQPQEMEGSTFSISNLGMFGIEEFTAIINPPNACILAVGAIRQEPVVKNGEIVVGNRMKVTLSCDHRVVDGATGSEFLSTFKSFMENPVTILA